MITTTELYRYPVKSMGGERLHAMTIGPNGVPGDRAWAVRDEKLGGIRGAKRFAEVMQFKARYVDEPAATGSSPAEVTLPNGTTLMSSDEGAAPAISGALGHPITLWPLLPADNLDHYRRGAPLEDDMEKELRRVFARDEGEDLPNLSIFPEMLMEFESPPGTYFDAFPILIITKQGLEALQKLAPESQFPVNRFRPNIVVDCEGQEGFPERDWQGKQVKIGSAVLNVTVECIRCQMVTHPVDEAPKDSNVMKTLIRNTNGMFGVYAEVATPGEIMEGDQLEVLG